MKNSSLLVLVCSVLSSGSAFAAEPLELTLGDSLAAPAVLELTLTAPTATQTVLIKTTKQRTVRVFVYGLGARVDNLATDQTPEGTIVRPDAPFQVKIKGRPGPAAIAIVDETTTPTARQVYAVPAKLEKLEDRDLDQYVLALNYKDPFIQTHSHDSAALAANLFLTIDKQLVVYATATAPEVRSDDRKTELWRSWECGFDVGEPLLILRVHGWGQTQTSDVLRATGQKCHLRGPLARHVSTTRPAQLVMPPPVLPAINQSLNRWKDEEFLRLAEANPRIAKYKSTKEAARKCSDALWDKLDPDASANRYDVVTYSGGKVKKVESLTEKNQRKVDATCKLPPIFKERDAIRTSLGTTYRKETEARLAEIATRLQP